jgi:Flp pilus assembly protein TadG
VEHRLSRVPVGSQKGQAIVEFALVLPILMAILLGIIQFGIVFNNYITLTDATRAGARKAAVSRFLNDNGASAKQAVSDAAAGLDLSKLNPTISVTASPDWNSPGGTVTVSASYPYSLNILGWTVVSGNLNSTTRERLE